MNQIGYLVTKYQGTDQSTPQVEARYKLLVDHCPDLIWDMNSDGLFRDVSVSWARVTGFQPSSLIGTSFVPLVHPDDIAACVKYLKRVLTSKEVLQSPEYRVRHADGTWHWHLATGTPVIGLDGNSISMVGVSRDITDRKLAEEKLRESEEKFRRVFQTKQAAIAINRLSDGMYYLVNERFTRRTGYTESELIGRTSSDVSIWENPEDWTRLIEGLARDGKVESFDVKFRRKDGRIISGSMSASVIDIDGIPHIFTDTRDNTDRKLAEERLRESEEKYRVLVENAGEAVYIVQDGCFKFTNPATEKLFGYPKEELESRPFIDFIHPDDRELVLDTYTKRLNAEEAPSRYEFKLMHPSGEMRWVELNSVLVQWEGKPAALNFLGDITDRKLAEEALRSSEEKFFKAFYANPAITSISTMAGGRFLDVNESFLQMHGFSREEVIGRTSVELGILSPEGRDALRCIFERNGCLRDYPILLGTKAGDVRDCLASGEVIDVAGKKHFLLQMNDITERKRAEKTLRESQKQLIEAHRLAHLGSWDVDLLTKKITWSEEIFRIFEKDTGCFTPTYKTVLDTVHPEDREALVAAYRQCLENHQPSKFTYRLLFADGRIKYLHEEREVFYSPKNKPLRIFGFSQDITELKQAEEEKKNLAIQLTQSQKMESVGRLAGGVAHDFNNMLSVIIGSAQLVIMKMNPADPLYKPLNDILNAGMRSADLTRQLLAFARKQTIKPKVLDLNDTIAGMLKMLQRLIGENIDLVWIPGKRLWQIKMDPSQVDQLLANLTVNARDAISKTGKIVIETSNVVCDETYCSTRSECVTGEYVLLSLSDDGCGMDKETLTNIFEPFFTTKKEGRGTGLGLSTVYGIIKQNGGFINVYSEPGQGTTFKIYVPRCEGNDSEILADDNMQKRIQGGTETVLIVEDEAAVLELSQDMLETLGYRVLTAKAAEQALRLVKAYGGPIDLLLIDVVMPDMNGKELSEKIMSIKPGLKRLYMSGYTADVIARQGILEEGVQLISKPFFLNDLAAKVREVLGS